MSSKFIVILGPGAWKRNGRPVKIRWKPPFAEGHGKEPEALEAQAQAHHPAPAGVIPHRERALLA